MKEELEVWKDIPGYEGLYQVSNLGRVKSLPRKGKPNGCFLKQPLSNKGYHTVNLCVNGICKCQKVHQLVAKSFLNHKPCGMDLVIDHINNIKTDNRVENLQIVTNRYNVSKDMKNKSSIYTGVFWHKIMQKWISQIRINNKAKYLGNFECELAASYAYQKALKEYEQKIN